MNKNCSNKKTTQKKTYCPKTFEIQQPAKNDVCFSSEKQLKEYSSFMSNFNIFVSENQIGDLLAQKNIRYNKNITVGGENFTIKVINATKNWQAMLLQLHYFNFQTQISLLNTNKNPDFLSEFQAFDSGGFGCIYVFESQNQKIAIKVIKLKKLKLKNIILEYFFNLIFDALSCGPAVSKQLGFDICLYNQIALFAMQFCQSSLHKVNAQDLFGQLKILHSLKIIHGDIKPQNIMYSKKIKKLVFCDFGITKIISQEIGKKTLTLFCGSVAYSSPEMFQLFKSSLNQQQPQRKFIDLYFNDFFCLKNGISFIADQSDAYFDKNQVFDQLPTFLSVNKIKHGLFVNKLSIQQIEQVYRNEIISFILNVKPTQYLYKLVTKLFGAYQGLKRWNQQQTQLHKIYTAQGILYENWNKIKQYESPQIIQFMGISNKNLCKMIKLRQITTLIQKQSDIHRLCKWYVSYLNCWQEQQWQAEQISSIFYAKMKSMKHIELTSLNPQSNSDFQQILFANLRKCQKLFIQIKDVDSLFQEAYFYRYFLLDSETNNEIVLKICDLFVNTSQVPLLDITSLVLNNIIANLIPDRQIFMSSYRWIREAIEKISKINQLQDLTKEITLYHNFLDRAIQLKNIQKLHLPECEIPLNHHFYHSYAVIRLCLISRAYLFESEYSQSILFLDKIQANFQFLSQKIKKTTNRFVECISTELQNVNYFEQLDENAKILSKIMVNNSCLTFFLEEQNKRQKNKAFKYLMIINANEKIDFFYRVYRTSNEIRCLLSEKEVCDHFILLYRRWFARICRYKLNSTYCYLSFLNIQRNLLRTKLIKKGDIDIILSQITPIFPRLSELQQARFYYYIIQLYFFSFRHEKVVSTYYQIQQMLKQFPKIWLKVCTYVSLSLNCLSRFNQSHLLAFDIFYRIKQHNDVYSLKSKQFVQLLQRWFNKCEMIEQYVQLFKMLVEKSYEDKKIQILINEYFVAICLTNKHVKQMLAISNYYLRIKYYADISLHNASVIIVYVVNKLTEKIDQKLKIMFQIATTIDTLNFTKKRVVTQYYKKIKEYHSGRKRKMIFQLWIQNKIKKQNRKSKVKRRLNIQLIRGQLY